MLPRPLRAGLLSILPLVGLGEEAAAQEGKAFPVIVRPEGKRWSIGDSGAHESCEPTCTLHLVPRSYKLTIGSATTEVYLDRPSEIAYRGPVRGLKYLGGGLVGIGVVGGVLMTVAATQACTGTTTANCTGSLFSGLSHDGQMALVWTAAGLFTSAVVGGILYYLGGESIRVRAVNSAVALSGVQLGVSEKSGWLGVQYSF